MNVNNQHDPAIDDARLDRLVDGELSPDEYQALLSVLDDEPGGWRRCALAFLEAQALRGELAAVRQSIAPARPVAAPVRKSDPVATWQRPLAVAASMLVAFTLGLGLPHLRKFGERPQVSAPPGDIPQRAERPDDPPGPQDSQPREIGSARLVLNGPGGQSQAGELPIYEYAGDPRAWLGQQQSALPPSLVSDLERRGHRVQRQQQYVPVDLEDGRRAVIPVEAIQITPVSRRAY